MSTILNTNGEELKVPAIHPNQRGTFYIVTADWNPDVTYPLRDGAVKVLRQAGVTEKNIRTMSVPGTVELVNAAGVIMENASPAAIIVIGCVIRGDTPHFDYVCQIAAQGVAELNARGETPVIFGVLTVDNLQQALDRAGGALGNKGEEAAAAAVTMANFPYLLWK